MMKIQYCKLNMNIIMIIILTLYILYDVTYHMKMIQHEQQSQIMSQQYQLFDDNNNKMNYVNITTNVTNRNIMNDIIIVSNNNNNNNNNTNHNNNIINSSFFHMAAHIAYESIYNDTIQQQQQRQKHEINNQTNNTKLFQLNQWNKYRTNGGLNDMDRIMISELYDNVTSVFEYGLGESTYIAYQVHVPKYSGIDTDLQWIINVHLQLNDMKLNSQSQNNDDKLLSHHFQLYYGDIGYPIKEWGYPMNDTLSKIFYSYQIAPLLLEPYPFDIYMIDGRYRIGCFLLSFLHASYTSTSLSTSSTTTATTHTTNDTNNITTNTTNTIVIIHDCYDQNHKRKYERYIYRTILDQYFIMIRNSGGLLCAYQRPNNLTDETIYQLWLQYRHIVS